MSFTLKSLLLLFSINLLSTLYFPLPVKANDKIQETSVGPNIAQDLNQQLPIIPNSVEKKEMKETPIIPDTTLEMSPLQKIEEPLTNPTKTKQILIDPQKEINEPIIPEKKNPGCSACEFLKNNQSKRLEKKKLTREKPQTETQNKVRPSEKRRQKQQHACEMRIKINKERAEKRCLKKTGAIKKRQERYDTLCQKSQEGANQRKAKKQQFRDRLRSKREMAERLANHRYESLVEEKLVRVSLLQDHKSLLKEHAQKQNELFTYIKQQKAEEARLQRAERETQKRELAKERHDQQIERLKFLQQMESEKLALRQKQIEQRRIERQAYQEEQNKQILAYKAERAKQRELLKQRKEQFAQLEEQQRQRAKDMLAQQKLLLREQENISEKVNNTVIPSLSTALSTK